MDSLFRVVFNNKVIRSLIFKAVSNLNKEEGRIVKKYGQCKIKWIVQNKHFQLLLYKLKNENKKRMEFTDELFYSNFLQYNKDLQLLKDILEMYPNYQSTTCNRLIENSCLNPNNETIINYLINEYQIIPTLKSAQYLCSIGELGLIKSFIDIGYIYIEDILDIGLLQCALLAKDLEFYKLVIELKPTLCQSLDSTKSKELLVNTKNIDFFKVSFDKMIEDENSLGTIVKKRPFHLDEYSSRFGTYEIIKYLCKNGYPQISFRDHYLTVFLKEITSRPKTDSERIYILDHFINQMSIPINIINHLSVFESCCLINNLDAIMYFNRKFKGSYRISSYAVEFTISRFCFDIFHWIFENKPIDTTPWGFAQLLDNIENSKTYSHTPETLFQLKLQLDTILKFRESSRQNQNQ